MGVSQSLADRRVIYLKPAVYYNKNKCSVQVIFHTMPFGENGRNSWKLDVLGGFSLTLCNGANCKDLSLLF